MNKIAILDVDDTVANMRSTLNETLNRVYGKDIHWTQWNTFNLERVYGINSEQFLDTLRREQVIERMVPHSESAEFTHKLKKMGYKIHILTARKWHHNGATVTRNWLKDHDIIFDDITVCDITDCKSFILTQAYDRVDLTVDDSLTHCRKYVDNHDIEQVFIYNMPWNKCDAIDSTRANRINNLSEVLEKLK